VIAEVALSFVLLAGSGLMLRSMMALQRVDPGFDPNGLLTFFLPNIRAQGLDGRAAFVQQLRREIGALPGVTAVAAASPLPLDGGTANMPWGTEAAASDPTAFQQATVHIVQPGYFEAMRAPVLAGRTFAETDNRLESTAIVIDHVLAAKAFPAEPAVGKRLLLRVGGNSPIPFEVVGVVRHQRHASLAGEGREAIFFPDGTRGFGVANRWVVRTDGDPTALAESVRAVVTRVDARVAISDVQPMSAFVDRAQAPTRFALVLTGIFAIIAVVLAVIGLYGVLSASVRQRTAEIGVRMAFGAARSAIFRSVVGRGLALAFIGLAVGGLAAFQVLRLISSLLVGVTPADPATFAFISLLFVVVAAVACGVPAFRASRLDATTALRAE
jgi:putative ABC transport system permease protein